MVQNCASSPVGYAEVAHLIGFNDKNEIIELVDSSVRPFLLSEEFYNDIGRYPDLRHIEKLNGISKQVFSKISGFDASEDIPRIRNDLEAEGIKTFESDIYYTQVYMKERGFTPCAWHLVSGAIAVGLPHGRYEMATYDISSAKIFQADDDIIPEISAMAIDGEMYGKTGGMPHVETDPIILSGLVFRDENGEREQIMIPAMGHYDDVLIEETAEAIIEKNPVFMLTYNGNTFDWPYFTERAKIGKANFRISRNFSMPYVTEWKTISIVGRPAIDLFGIAKFVIPKGSRKSQPILHRELRKSDLVPPTKFVEINRDEIAKLWDNPETRQNVIDHCASDVQLTMDIFEYAWTFIVELSSLTGIPPDQVLSVPYSVLVEGFLIKIAKEFGYVIPKNRYNLQPKTSGAFTMKPTRGIPENVSVFDFACISDDTQCLTKNGWKYRNQLILGEDILTFNKDLGTLEYQPLDNIHNYDFNGNLINIKTRHLDILCTPKHRTLFRDKRKDKGLQVSMASDLKTYIEIPVAGNFQGEELDISDDKIRLLAWIITEGHIRPDISITIVQSMFKHKKYCEDIEKALIGSGVAFVKKERFHKTYKKWIMEFRINAEDTRKLCSEFNLQKHKIIPDFMFYASMRQREMFLNELIKGDGTFVTQKSSVYTSCDGVLSDQVQVLSIISGYRSILKSDRDNYERFVFIKKTSGAHVGIKKYHNVKYSGIVWCPSVENSFFVARRNGRPFITGNSMYPIILINSNISPETYVPNPDPDDIKRGLYHVIESDYGKKFYFMKSPEGFFVKAMKRLLGRISDAKKRYGEKKYKQKYAGEVQALKTIARSMYGYLKAPKSRWFLAEAQEAVACEGRNWIHRGIKVAERYGYVNIYSDTDSSFLTGLTQKEGEEFAEILSEELGVKVGLDKFYTVLFFTEAKKKYAGLKSDGDVDYVGFMKSDWCFDKNVEVLTLNGWKKFYDLSIDDMLMTCDTSLNMKYQFPTRLIKKRFDGNMARLKSGAIDIMVTPQHQMFARENNQASYKFKTASEMIGSFYAIPRTGYWCGKETDKKRLKKVSFKHGHKICKEEAQEIDMDFKDWADFLALYLAEGWTFTKGNKASIGQKTNIGLARSILSKMPYHVCEHKRKDGLIIFTISDKWLSRELSIFGHSKSKYIPDEIKLSCQEVIRSFLDNFVQFDGSVHNGYRTFFTSSKRLANDIQELLLKSGTAGNVSQLNIKISKKWELRGFKTHMYYSVREIIGKNIYLVRSRNFMESCEYHDDVYCVSVPNGIIYVRSNGKALWCGNCPIANYTQKKVLEIILKKKDVNAAVEFSRMIVQGVRENVFPLNKFIIWKRIKVQKLWAHDYGKYAHVVVARKNPEKYIEEDGTVGYVVVKGVGNLSHKARHYSEVTSVEDLDVEYYIKKQIGAVTNLILKYMYGDKDTCTEYAEL